MSSLPRASVFAAADRLPGRVGVWSPPEFPVLTLAELIVEDVASNGAADEITAEQTAAEEAFAREQDALVEAIALANRDWEAQEAVRREGLRAEAYQEGYEEGRLAGELAEGVRLANARQVTERALEDVRSGEEKWVGTIEENIAALAVAIARQLLGRELRGDTAAIADPVRRALTEFPIDQPIRIRVSPGALAVLSTVGSAEPITQGREAAWIADAQLAPGGCLVEGRERIVDGRVDAALERVYRRLTYTHA
jgi:flagellar assembly protein FliH